MFENWRHINRDQASWEKASCEKLIEKRMVQCCRVTGELLQDPGMFQACSKGRHISCWCLHLNSAFLVPSASSPPASHGAEPCPVMAEVARCCRRSLASYGSAKPVAPRSWGCLCRDRRLPWLGAEGLCSGCPPSPMLGVTAQQALPGACWCAPWQQPPSLCKMHLFTPSLKRV